MQFLGLIMLAAVPVVMVLTGLPAFMAMIGSAAVCAVVGLSAGAIQGAWFGALPARVIGLLENDLLQALPLFVLMGALLNRLPLAGIVFRVLTRLLGGPVLAGLGLGALLAPMNGSVGASAMTLTRVVAPRLEQVGVPVAKRLAVLSASATLGVVVPPSLVLILFGDAMMRAHTEALNITRVMTRVVNTQDIFRGALVPGALVFVLYLLLVWWSERREATRAEPHPVVISVSIGDWAIAGVTLTALIGLMACVVVGVLYAVEAAATGAMALAIVGLVTGALRGQSLRDLLSETMAMTGALFALFVAATSFTLVFRALDSDRLLTDLVIAMPGGSTGAVVLVLGLIGICALVLDAFEIVLVIVPLLLPPLLVRAPDAVWDATLVLLVLQTSFLIPPFGYAVMLTRGLGRMPVPIGATIRAVAPFLLAQVLVLSLVAAFPALVHMTAPVETGLTPVMSEDAARKAMMALPSSEE